MRGPFSGNYFIIIFIVIMVFRSIQSDRFSSPGQWLLNTLMILPAIVIGLTLHEFAHAYSAWRLGDMTPKAQGRVTLNPISHIDPVGIIALIFVGFGWGRPVQVNPYAFRKNRRLANLIVDIAGVTTNFVIAFFCTALLFIVPYGGVAFTLVLNIVYINLVLMLFNLLPIPPLDGFGIITEVFDLRRFSWHQGFYKYGTIILLVLIVFGAVGGLLMPALSSILYAFQTVWGFIL